MNQHLLKSRSLRGLAAVVLGLALGACATLSQKPETAVKARADARWAALVKGDVKAAYDLTAPSYRKVTTFERYRGTLGSGAVAWQSGTAETVNCAEATKCTARVKISAAPLVRPGLPPIITYADEAWLLEDGQWWLLPRL